VRGLYHSSLPTYPLLTLTHSCSRSLHPTHSDYPSFHQRLLTMQIPNEIILQIASHIPLSQGKTLSSLSKTSSSIHSLLSPTLYSNIELSQKTLVYLLNNPSENFKFVKSITLTHIWSDFDIDHTKSITSLPPNEVVFRNATTLKLQDTMDTSLSFDPLPIMASFLNS
jgi:hypothetical protein